MARRSSPSRPAPAGWSRSAGSPSRCSTRSATRAPTCCRSRRSRFHVVVRFAQLGADRVRMTGAKGRAPGPDYKAIATWDDGFFANWVFPMRGVDAGDKARAIAFSVLKRGARMLEERGLAQLRRSRVDVVGNEDSYGAQARAINSREVYCRVAIEAADEAAFQLIFREQGTGSVSMAPGIAVSRMMVFTTPLARSESFLLPVDEVPVTVTLGDRSEVVSRDAPPSVAPLAAPPEPPPPNTPADRTLIASANWPGRAAATRAISPTSGSPRVGFGISALYRRRARCRNHGSRASMRICLTDGAGRVDRFYLPGSNALNFMLHDALDWRLYRQHALRPARQERGAGDPRFRGAGAFSAASCRLIGQPVEQKAAHCPPRIGRAGRVRIEQRRDMLHLGHELECDADLLLAQGAGEGDAVVDQPLARAGNDQGRRDAFEWRRTGARRMGPSHPRLEIIRDTTGRDGLAEHRIAVAVAGVAACRPRASGRARARSGTSRPAPATDRATRRAPAPARRRPNRRRSAAAIRRPRR